MICDSETRLERLRVEQELIARDLRLASDRGDIEESLRLQIYRASVNQQVRKLLAILRNPMEAADAPEA